MPLNRGAKIYCELVGYGAASDAYHVTATHPEGIGAELAMKDALKDSGFSFMKSIISTHMPLQHRWVILANVLLLIKFSGKSLKNVYVSATKSMTGHFLGAAGAIEAIASVKAIENNKIPPTINTKNIDPHIPRNLEIVLQKPIEKEIKVAMNNTFGFGGHTVSTVFKKMN